MIKNPNTSKENMSLVHLLTPQITIEGQLFQKNHKANLFFGTFGDILLGGFFDKTSTFFFWQRKKIQIDFFQI